MSVPINIILGAVGSSGVIAALDSVKGALAGMAAAGISATAAIAAVTKTLNTGVEFNANIEQQTLAFETLLGSATRAKTRVADLYDFAAKTPFQFPEIVQASKLLQSFTGDALSAGDGLRLVGDSAAAVGKPIGDVAMWVGRLYAALSAGLPAGEPIARLTELGLLSNATRAKLQALSGQALSQAEVMRVLREAFGFATGAMEKQSTTLTGLKSTFSDSFAAGAAGGVRDLNDSLKGMYGELTRLVSSPGFQQFVHVFADRADMLVGGITAVARAAGSFVGSPMASVALTGADVAGTLFAAHVGAKVVQKLDLALVAWASTGGASIGSKLATSISNGLPKGMLAPMAVGLAAVIATEVALGLYQGYQSWRAGQLDAANAGFDRVGAARTAASAVGSDADRVAAAKQLVDLEKQTLDALVIEEGRLWKNNAAIASYRQQLDQIRLLQTMLNSEWGTHQIALNQAAAAATRLSESVAALRAFEEANLSLATRRTRLSSDLAKAQADEARLIAEGNARGEIDAAGVASASLRAQRAKADIAKIDAEIAKQAAETARAWQTQLDLGRQIAQLELEQQPLGEQRTAATERLRRAEEKYYALFNGEKISLEALTQADLERLRAKQSLLSIDEQIAQRAATAARAALEDRQSEIQRRITAIDADYTRTDAEKWGERKARLEDAVTAAKEYLATAQAARAAATTDAGRAQGDANVRTAQQDLAGAEANLANNGADPNSFLDQLKAGLAGLRAEWGTTAQFMARSMTEAITTAQGATSNFLFDGLSGARSWSDAWDAATLQVGQQFLRMITDQISKLLWKSTVERALVALGVTTHVTGEAAKTTATGAGVATRIGLVIKEALASVYKGAVQAFEALSSIPYVGPLLGAAAMAAAIAGGISLVSKIGHAEGGYHEGAGWVSGPGTATSDSVNARLSDGEWVAPVWQTKHPVWGPMIRTLEAGRRGEMPGFASGGLFGSLQLSAARVYDYDTPADDPASASAAAARTAAEPAGARGAGSFSLADIEGIARRESARNIHLHLSERGWREAIRDDVTAIAREVFFAEQRNA